MRARERDQHESLSSTPPHNSFYSLFIFFVSRFFCYKSQSGLRDVTCKPQLTKSQLLCCSSSSSSLHSSSTVGSIPFDHFSFFFPCYSSATLCTLVARVALFFAVDIKNRILCLVVLFSSSIALLLLRLRRLLVSSQFHSARAAIGYCRNNADRSHEPRRPIDTLLSSKRAVLEGKTKTLRYWPRCN